jgi:predicted negative regulator of RcsB-dependent stress response
VGLKREAEFKWRQALELNPEPEDAEKIRMKLDKGYESVAAKGG